MLSQVVPGPSRNQPTTKSMIFGPAPPGHQASQERCWPPPHAKATAWTGPEIHDFVVGCPRGGLGITFLAGGRSTPPKKVIPGPPLGKTIESIDFRFGPCPGPKRGRMTSHFYVVLIPIAARTKLVRLPSGLGGQSLYRHLSHIANRKFLN